MNTIDEKKLESLVADQKWDEAKALLDEFFKSEMTPAEKGELYANLASIYMKVMTNINHKYSAALGDAIENLKQIETDDGTIKDTLDLSKTRDQLKNS